MSKLSAKELGSIRIEEDDFDHFDGKDLAKSVQQLQERREIRNARKEFRPFRDNDHIDQGGVTRFRSGKNKR